MKKSVRTVLSLTIDIVNLLDDLLNILKTETNYKINKSKIIRVSVIYLSSYEENELKNLLIDFKHLSKWQTNKVIIKEITVTLNEKCLHLLELMSQINVDYKIYKSGLIRLAIIKLSKENNFIEIFTNLIKEV